MENIFFFAEIVIFYEWQCDHDFDGRLQLNTSNAYEKKRVINENKNYNKDNIKTIVIKTV